ncbi:SusC/RagA family TonB-linked outer membrane protein [Chitinophaga niabensis]|uniref:TonB-linked outer membrane protein, SusC/RagA family n=1 Tax=Chitinophaga niabensis TaxID=536979 RepID=A0A1N6KB07_9BACT|nr:SusC/RagA family TonB-linked outer membrane protein [Chitinophaga niabensis]SIO53721.1 TonB-linked outer membrane protein, SusC/RagA family [Chitinophaga niabensis]
MQYYYLRFSLYRRTILIFGLLLLFFQNSYAFQDSALVTLNVSNTSIESVFKNIEQQTGVVFVYAATDLNGKDQVSIKVRKVKIGAAVDLLLKGKNVTWKRVNGGIVIRRKDEVSNGSTIPSNNNVFNDSLPGVTIKGTVTGEEGGPLPGATVQVRGTSIGTMTNAQGQFSLSNVPAKSSIIITYTGFQMTQISIRDQETFVIRLKRATTGLDEQVVIAYGTSSKRMLTGSVGRVTAKDIEKQPVGNPIAALYARVPGLVITQQTGVPGGGFKVEIRGQNSLRNSPSDNGNIPLYIIDGVPFNSTSLSINGIQSIYPQLSVARGASPLNSINPSDIESIEVLKDADATAIYGSRGANGVILITTKKGRSGQMQVDANFYTGAGKVTRMLDLLNTQQYLEMRKEAFSNDGVTTYPINAYDVNGTWDQNKYTNWQKELIGGTAKTTDGQISVSGGTLNSQYRFGAGYHKETTVFPGDYSDQRFSTHFSLVNTSPNQKFKSQISANYSIGNTNLLSQDLTGRSLTYVPNAPDLLDANGNLNWPTGVSQNPLQYTRQPYNAKSNNLFANLTVSYELLKGLILKSSFGYTNSTNKEKSKIPKSSLLPSIQAVTPNSTQFGNSFNNSWSIEPQITYQKRIDKHRINVLVGSAFQEQNSEALSQSASGFATEALMDNIGAVPNTNVSTAFNTAKYRYNAIFGRLAYDYSEKYLLTLTGRRDGSSRFGPGKQFANFGSIGAAWIFTNEQFIKNNLGFLSFGKLRGSYGSAGSDQTPNYGFLDLYTTSTSYQGIVGLTPKQLFNPDYAWEINRKIEGALELGFLRDRILFSAAYYTNRSSNQLVGYPLPPTAGFGSVQFNLDAIVQNVGYEFELNTTILDKKFFKWNTSFNLSIPKNKLVSYPNLAGSSYANTYVVGEPLGINKLYKYKGVNPQTGLHEVEDIDKNGSYNAADLQSINFLGAKYYGGLTNTIEWKGIQLDLLFQFTKQAGRNYLALFGSQPGLMFNQPIEVLNRWKNAGDITTVQKFRQTLNTEYGRYAASNASVTDASFIRLKNLSLSYNIPRHLIEKAKIKNVKISVQGQNLITITNYKGLDPESQGNVLPPLRFLTAGLQVTL